jgi:hypothetical protein
MSMSPEEAEYEAGLDRMYAEFEKTFRAETDFLEEEIKEWMERENISRGQALAQISLYCLREIKKTEGPERVETVIEKIRLHVAKE